MVVAVMTTSSATSVQGAGGNGGSEVGSCAQPKVARAITTHELRVRSRTIAMLPFPRKGLTAWRPGRSPDSWIDAAAPVFPSARRRTVTLAGLGCLQLGLRSPLTVAGPCRRRHFRASPGFSGPGRRLRSASPGDHLLRGQLAQHARIVQAKSAG